MISARLAAGLHPFGAALLASFGPVAAIPFVLLPGAGNGLLTIARGTLPRSWRSTGTCDAPMHLLRINVLTAAGCRDGYLTAGAVSERG